MEPKSFITHFYGKGPPGLDYAILNNLSKFYYLANKV